MGRGSDISVVETAGFAGVMFIIGSAFLALSPLLPYIAREFGVAAVALGLPGGAYSFSFGLTALISAPIQDRVPRRLMIIVGIAFHISGLLLAAKSANLYLFVLGFTICGAGAGVLQPAIYALVSDLTTPITRGALVGRVNFGWAASTLIGVPIVAAVTPVFGWRHVLTIWALLWILIVLALHQRLIRCTQQQLDDKTTIKTTNVAGGVARYTALFLATVLIFTGFYAEYTFLGVAIDTSSTTRFPVMSLLVSAYGAGFLAGTLNTSRIDRIGVFTVLKFLLPALGILLLVAPQLISNVFLMTAAMAVWGGLQALTFTSLTMIAGSSNPSIRGRTLAYNAACVMAGASLGATMAGPVFARFGFGMVGLLSALVTLGAAALLYLGMRGVKIQ